MPFFISFFVVGRMLTKSRCFFFGVAIQKTHGNPCCTARRHEKKRILVVCRSRCWFQVHLNKHMHQNKRVHLIFRKIAQNQKQIKPLSLWVYDIFYNIYQVYEFKINRSSPEFDQDEHAFSVFTFAENGQLTTWFTVNLGPSSQQKCFGFWFQSSWGRCALLKPHTPGTSPVAGYSENGVCCLSSEQLLPRCNLVDVFKKSSVRLEQNSPGKLTKVWPENGRMKRLLKSSHISCSLALFRRNVGTMWMLQVNGTGSGRKIGQMFVDCLHLRLEGIF